MPVDWGDDTKALYEVIQEEGDAAACLCILPPGALCAGACQRKQGGYDTVIQVLSIDL